MFYIIVGVAIAIVIFVLGIFYLNDTSKEQRKKIRKKVFVLCTLFGAISVTVGVLLSAITFVPAGAVGVHDLFGDVSYAEMDAGLNLKNPFAHVEMMSIKTREIKETSEVPSSEGLIVRLDTSILFRIKPSEADVIYRTLGIYYWDVAIIPQLRSVIREVTSSYEAKALYTTGRLNITQDIFDGLYDALDERGIILEKVLLRDLGIPQKLTDAIEMKLTAEQQIEQKEFDVFTAEKEANRKRVEARGIADANDIIASSLTENYLRWYWIENLDTHNSVIYVPVGDGGMPLFKEVGGTN